MAMIVELSLWGDLASSACAADACTKSFSSSHAAGPDQAPADMLCDDYVGVSFPDGVSMSELIHRLGPVCARCRYCGLCDSDDCAMKIHPLDMRHAPTERGWRTWERR